MLKLLKYEFRKTRTAKIVLFAIAVVLEGLFLYALNRKNSTTETVTLIALIALALFGILIIGIQSVISLHRDMNTRQSHMLFMTPHSGYAILGAKTIEFMLSTVIAAVVFFGTVYGNLSLLLKYDQSVEEVSEFLKMILSSLGSGLDLSLPHVICFSVYLLSSFLSMVVLAFLADVISSSFLNGKKGGLLITLILYIVLDTVIAKLVGLIPLGDGNVRYLLQAAVTFAYSVILYIVTVKMMDKFLSV